MRATQIRVLLVDDHDVVRAGVRTLVEAQGWQVSAEASSGKEAVKLANDVPTDVASSIWKWRIRTVSPSFDSSGNISRTSKS